MATAEPWKQDSTIWDSGSFEEPDPEPEIEYRQLGIKAFALPLYFGYNNLGVHPDTDHESRALRYPIYENSSGEVIDCWGTSYININSGDTISSFLSGPGIGYITTVASIVCILYDTVTQEIMPPNNISRSITGRGVTSSFVNITDPIRLRIQEYLGLTEEESNNINIFYMNKSASTYLLEEEPYTLELNGSVFSRDPYVVYLDAFPVTLSILPIILQSTFKLGLTPNESPLYVNSEAIVRYPPGVGAPPITSVEAIIDPFGENPDRNVRVYIYKEGAENLVEYLPDFQYEGITTIFISEQVLLYEGYTDRGQYHQMGTPSARAGYNLNLSAKFEDPNYDIILPSGQELIRVTRRIENNSSSFGLEICTTFTGQQSQVSKTLYSPLNSTLIAERGGDAEKAFLGDLDYNFTPPFVVGWQSNLDWELPRTPNLLELSRENNTLFNTTAGPEEFLPTFYRIVPKNSTTGMYRIVYKAGTFNGETNFRAAAAALFRIVEVPLVPEIVFVGGKPDIRRPLNKEMIRNNQITAPTGVCSVPSNTPNWQSITLNIESVGPIGTHTPDPLNGADLPDVIKGHESIRQVIKDFFFFEYYRRQRWEFEASIEASGIPGPSFSETHRPDSLRAAVNISQAAGASMRWPIWKWHTFINYGTLIWRDERFSETNYVQVEGNRDTFSTHKSWTTGLFGYINGFTAQILPIAPPFESAGEYETRTISNSSGGENLDSGCMIPTFHSTANFGSGQETSEDLIGSLPPTYLFGATGQAPTWSTRNAGTLSWHPRDIAETEGTQEYNRFYYPVPTPIKLTFSPKTPEEILSLFLSDYYDTIY